MNSVKEKLKKGKPVFGGWIMTASPVVAELFTRVGFDWVAIDTEHASVSAKDLPIMLGIIEKGGAVPFVRLAHNDPVLIKQALDAGAGGLIAPQINSPAEARAFVSAALFPPEGSRGVSFCRASGYGDRFDEYVRNFNRNVILVAMIENVAALAEIKKIIAVPGIDALFIGPYDLSASLGRPGEFSAPSFRSTLGKIEKAAARAKMPMGMHVVPPDNKQIKSAVNKGYLFIGCSVDTRILLHGARAMMDGLK
jgi:2-dehydro-3-deoxyglucarate aldolase